jgi:hypothetical protein
MRNWANTLTLLRIVRFWKDKALSCTAAERAKREEEKQKEMEYRKMQEERAALLFGPMMVHTLFISAISIASNIL